VVVVIEGVEGYLRLLNEQSQRQHRERVLARLKDSDTDNNHNSSSAGGHGRLNPNLPHVKRDQLEEACLLLQIEHHCQVMLKSPKLIHFRSIKRKPQRKHSIILPL
jgi:hypothetical protein